ncbi:MAG: cobalamin-dependent protein, partial [Clostridia bacterium]|nr:cobalamin-dependent protein [Clostridia bacterium]
MKVILVAMNGSYSHTNLAVRCLRPGLEKSGYDVQLAEYQLRDRTGHVLNDLYQLDGDIYGFSVYIWNLDIVTELSRELKKIKPNIHIIWGGPEVSFETERFESYDYIDNIITGEGEISIVNVCNAIKNGQPLSKVVIGQPSSEVMKDEGILYREGENSSSRLFYYESSRGCPFKCAYCLASVCGKVRGLSVERVKKDIDFFLTHEIRQVKF